MSSVLVVMEQARGGGWHRISREALAAGQTAGSEMKHAVLGGGAGDADALATLAAELADEGVATVWAVEHPLLERYTADAFVAALQQLDCGGEAGVCGVSAYVPGARFCAGAGDADGRGAGERCDRDAMPMMESGDFHAAVDAAAS